MIYFLAYVDKIIKYAVYMHYISKDGPEKVIVFNVYALR